MRYLKPARGKLRAVARQVEEGKMNEGRTRPLSPGVL